MGVDIAKARLSGLNRHSTKQRSLSLQRIRSAADALFGTVGFAEVSFEQVASGADVTRKTLYKHFAGKAELAFDWARRRWPGVKAEWVKVLDADPADALRVRCWTANLIGYYDHNPEVRSIAQIGFMEPDYGDLIFLQINELIDTLGCGIGAFRFDDGSPDFELRWGRAYLVLREMMQECSSMALGRSRLQRDVLVDLLAERFHGFVMARQGLLSPEPT